ncbi:nucleotidyltransferase domain-containing protein [Candidatus Poribacteria bacterium]|nr:nucleotidyltransferase domain-containing protein [Candidatus Poribacteria bacterium]
MAVRFLEHLAPVREAYVFGSQAEGRATEWSDIDVAFFMEGIGDWDIHRRAGVMADVEDAAGLDVEAHLFPASVIDHPLRGSFAEYVRKHGVALPLGEIQSAPETP